MSSAQMIQDPRVALSLTISSGTALSSAVDLMGYAPLALMITNSTWSSAAISFVALDPGTSTYLPVYSDTAEVSISSALTKGGAKAFTFRADYARVLAGYSFIKVRSGLAAGAVNQAKDVPITLIVGPLNP